jgi:hypothetical protein
MRDDVVDTTNGETMRTMHLVQKKSLTWYSTSEEIVGTTEVMDMLNV